MKVGSIVVVLPLSKDMHYEYLKHIKWLPKDDENTPYMIRDIDDQGNDIVVVFEEGIMGHFHGRELGLDVKYVREILPPEEISISQVVEYEEVSFG